MTIEALRRRSELASSAASADQNLPQPVNEHGHKGTPEQQDDGQEHKVVRRSIRFLFYLDGSV
jgi:hypothetical protein